MTIQLNFMYKSSGASYLNVWNNILLEQHIAAVVLLCSYQLQQCSFVTAESRPIMS